MNTNSRISIKVRQDRVSPLLKDMEALAESNASLKEALQLFLDVPDFINKIAAVNVDTSAAGAGEMFVTLEPTDFFRDLSAAFLSGDTNKLIIQHRNLLSLQEI